MKKILLLLILGFIGGRFLLPTFNFVSCANEQNVVHERVEEEHVEEHVNEEAEEINVKELSLMYVNKELEDIEPLKKTDKLKWYKRYKKIICKYKNVIDQPLSVFDVYTEEEVNLICRAVETECYGQDFDAKCNVASVIFNRIDSGKYGATVEEVITSPKQFTYWRTTIPEDTLYAVMYIFEIEDITNGCLSFHSNERTEKFGGRSYVFTDSSGHHFYR